MRTTEQLSNVKPGEDGNVGAMAHPGTCMHPMTPATAKPASCLVGTGVFIPLVSRPSTRKYSRRGATKPAPKPGKTDSALGTPQALGHGNDCARRIASRRVSLEILVKSKPDPIVTALDLSNAQSSCGDPARRYSCSDYQPRSSSFSSGSCAAAAIPESSPTSPPAGSRQLLDATSSSSGDGGHVDPLMLFPRSPNLTPLLAPPARRSTTSSERSSISSFFDDHPHVTKAANLIKPTWDPIQAGVEAANAVADALFSSLYQQVSISASALNPAAPDTLPQPHADNAADDILSSGLPCMRALEELLRQMEPSQVAGRAPAAAAAVQMSPLTAPAAAAAIRSARAAAAWAAAEASSCTVTATPAAAAGAEATQNCYRVSPTADHTGVAGAQMIATAAQIQQKQQQLQELEHKQQLLQQKISDCRARARAISGQYSSSSRGSHQGQVGCDLAPATTAWAPPAAATMAAGSAAHAHVAFGFPGRSSGSNSSMGDAPSWNAFATASGGPSTSCSHELSCVSFNGATSDHTFTTHPTLRRCVTISGYPAEAPGGRALMAAAAMGSESMDATRFSTDLLLRQVQGNGGWHAAVQELHDDSVASSGYGSCYDAMVGRDLSVSSNNAFWEGDPIGNELLVAYDMY